MPLDMELSPQELISIITAARRWRGNDGGRRRLVVTDIEIEYFNETAGQAVGEGGEEDGASRRAVATQVLTHMALYTCPLHGVKQVALVRMREMIVSLRLLRPPACVRACVRGGFAEPQTYY